MGGQPYPKERKKGAITAVPTGRCAPRDRSFPTKSSCQDRPSFSGRQEVNQMCAVFTTIEDILSHVDRTWTPPRPSNFSNFSARSQLDERLAELRESAPYGHGNVQSVKNTIKYFYYRFRRGVYVSIRNDKLVSFATFVNMRYNNPLGPTLVLSETTRKKLAEAGYGAPKPSSQWYTIDCLVNNVVQNQPSASGKSAGPEPTYFLTEVQAWLESAVSKKPDCDFVLNTHDFCALRRDLCESQLSLTGGRKVRIDHLQPRQMCPIVSFAWAPEYSDFPFPTPDDIARLTLRYFPPRCSNGHRDAEISSGSVSSFKVPAWTRRHSIALFRGSASGCGWSVRDNPRLAAVALSARRPDLLNAKLVPDDSELRLKKSEADRFVRSNLDDDHEKFDKNADNFMSLAEQARYKYILDLPGTAAAYRLGTSFSMGSLVIILPHERSRLWFHDLLRHGHNCLLLPVGLQGQALQDQIETTLEWCRSHDRECRNIAASGHTLYKKILNSKDFVAEYTRRMLSAMNLHH